MDVRVRLVDGQPGGARRRWGRISAGTPGSQPGPERVETALSEISPSLTAAERQEAGQRHCADARMAGGTGEQAGTWLSATWISPATIVGMSTADRSGASDRH